jgi:toxin CcdB
MASAPAKQFTVYRNKNPRTRTLYPYLLDIQAPLLESLQTRTVAPMIKASALQKKAIDQITPLVTFDSEKYLLLIPQLAGIARSDLGTRAGDLSRYREQIIAAVDFLFLGI